MITLDLTEMVTVTGGSPALVLNDGAAAQYVSGSGSSALNFLYTVGANDHVGSLGATSVNLNGATIADAAGNAANLSVTSLSQNGPQIGTVQAQTIQDDYLAITRTVLSLADATTEANAINAGTTTETGYINSLLAQVADTTIPAVAVEASMYGAVGSSAEVTSLVTNFLPAQLAYAAMLGVDLTIFATEALGLAFATGNETGATTFATNFGPSNSNMPDTAAGDAAFAAAASSAIFGAQSNAILVNFISTHLSYWVNLYTAFGLPGNPQPSADQIDLAARGAAWGDAVGIALVDNAGPLPALVTNFLEDAAQGTAVYSASLASQPTAFPFQGATSLASAASHVQLTGVLAHTDHMAM